MLKQFMNTIKRRCLERMDVLAYRDISRLAEQGRADAQLALAKMYETGNAAVEQDRVSAYVLYMSAARKGMKEAEVRLQSLASVMPAEQWQMANKIIRQLEAID